MVPGTIPYCTILYHTVPYQAREVHVAENGRPNELEYSYAGLVFRRKLNFDSCIL